MVSEFRNEPLTDFNQPANKKAMQEALTKVRAEFNREYPIIIDGEGACANYKIRSINPANKTEIVGTTQKGSSEMAKKAIAAAKEKFTEWKYTPATKRADYLFNMAEILRARKHEFSATMVYEIGKSWAEADADTAEAIDFCEFYAREALRYAEKQPVVPYPGENNELVYLPLGVGAIIPPWNFPLAILVGMTTAAIVTGNTVVLKPASDTTIIAAKFVEATIEAGLPSGVLNFVTGSGADVGETLITSPDIRFISFTGSKEVGLHIVEESGKTRPDQKWIKRYVVEMGGKDAIIVDDECDLDAAVEGVALSAYGFQGQKCSACSRAIVSEKVYDEFLNKLTERVKKIKVGPTENFENYMGPVASQAQYTKIMEYIQIGQKEGRLLFGGEGHDDQGFFIQPTIFADVAPTARIAQEEIFGPVLAVIKAKNFDDALKIANGTDYGLTGGVFTKNKDKLAKAKHEFFVGNLYLNRKCTGALVGVQPFGGFNMSGTDSKAGGRDYLLQFMQAKSICEKL
ncbi:MAG: L-glutamate gamma-semialdehyde dehydrogenase [Pseudomonadota bacterium]